MEFQGLEAKTTRYIIDVSLDLCDMSRVKECVGLSKYRFQNRRLTAIVER